MIDRIAFTKTSITSILYTPKTNIRNFPVQIVGKRLLLVGIFSGSGDEDKRRGQPHGASFVLVVVSGTDLSVWVVVTHMSYV